MAGLGAVLVLTVATVALLRTPPPPEEESSSPSSSPSSSSSSDRSWKEKQPFFAGPIAPTGKFVDVVRPGALKPILTQNAWLKATADEPLGRGFLGGWAGLLGSAGEELGLQKLTQGVIGELIVDALLVQPLQLAWFSGWGGSTPALIIPEPTDAVKTTYAAIVGAVERGGFTIERCPGDPPPPAPPPPAPTDGTATDSAAPNSTATNSAAPSVVVPATQTAISRLVVADQPVFASLTRGRLVLSRDVQSVVNAVCSPSPTIATVAGADLVVGINPAQVGRDVQAFAGLLGLVGAPMAAFKVEGSALRPVGLTGTVKTANRLGSEAITDALWGLVPEDLPVAAAVNLRLPKTLSAETLTALYAGSPSELTTRQVLVLWQPHGKVGAETEVAVVWSDVADRDAVEQLFTGPNPMTVRVVCERVVVSSSASLLSRIEAACTQKSPSLHFAAPSIVQGLKERASLGVVIDVGRVLSTLLHEGFVSDPAVTTKKGEIPVEIEAAKKRLLELPRLGLFGEVQGEALVPRGFSS
jgi:hypothetical protein